MHIGYETLMEQAGLRKVCGAREQTASVNESWTVQGSTTKMSIWFIDYTKDFENVQNFKMWNSIGSVGIPKHLTVLIWGLHTEYEAKCTFTKAQQNGYQSKKV